MSEVEADDQEHLEGILNFIFDKLGLVRAAGKGDQWKWTVETLARDVTAELYPQLHSRVQQSLSPQELTRNTLNQAKVGSAIPILENLLSFLKSGQ